jgi:hypothetical protein
MEIFVANIDPFYNEGMPFIMADVLFREDAFPGEEETPTNQATVRIAVQVDPSTPVGELESILLQGARQFLRRILE